MNGESESEEDARLKSGHHGKLPGGKRKKVDLEEDEAVDITSDFEAESGGKASARVHRNYEGSFTIEEETSKVCTK